jgi:cytoskeletal protein CcmA (bactofilin family)
MADVTVVGQGMFLRGSIRGEGDLDIRGRIEGDIEVVGEVTIGEGALVKANVNGRRITVRGAVAGNLTGQDGVRLEEGARVVGDLRGASIGIAEGALLRGNVQTGQAGEAQKGRVRTAATARPAVRAEPRKAPAQAAPAVKGNGSPRKVAPATVAERTGPPPPVVPALKKGTRAALRKRSR